MNTKRLVLALMFALVCSALLTSQISRHLAHRSPLEQKKADKLIVVVTRDVRSGETLPDTALKLDRLPASASIAGALDSIQQVAGRVAQVGIRIGEPVFEHDLAPANSGVGLAVAIPAGMRAVSVRATDNMTGTSAYLVPGSYVDVLVTYRSPTVEEFVSSTVLQDKRVLAVGDNREIGTQGKSGPDDTIVLLVTPDEAARLTVANSLGKVTLILRNGADRAVNAGLLHTKLDGITNQSISGRTVTTHTREASVLTQTSKPDFKVEVLAGGKSTVQTFQGEQQ